MLWELLTFHRLFKAEGEAETLNRLLYLPNPTVREIDPEVPVELERVAMRALARDPSQRYGSALEMGDALRVAGRVFGCARDFARCGGAPEGGPRDRSRTRSARRSGSG